MKHVVKPFGQPETDEAKAVRLLCASPGWAQSIEQIVYLDAKGDILAYKQGPMVAPSRARAERYTLTDAAAAKHDEILDNLQAGFLG